MTQPDAPTTTIFERTSALARELGAINLGQGFPDLPEPAELLAAAQRALVEKPNQYPPMRGLSELRQAVAHFYAREQGLALTPEQVIVTSGATEALAAAVQALIRPGDEALLLQPFYDAYLPMIERAGGTVRTVNLTPPEWRLPLGRIAAAIGPKTRLIVLNTPNNPAGTLADRPELEALAALCEQHNVWVLSDEVWEGMVYGEARHLSALAVPGLAERTVKVGSAGKIFSLTGWKVGWAIAPAGMAETIATRHQYLTFTVPPALQWAVAEGLALSAEWHRAHRERYAPLRARLVRGLEAAGYAVLPADGTWFVNVDLAASGLPADDVAVADRLVREAGVAAIPVSAFYRDAPEYGFVRLCFAKEPATLDAAVERLAGLRSSPTGGGGPLA